MPDDPLNQSVERLASLNRAGTASCGEAWLVDDFFYFMGGSFGGSEGSSLLARYDTRLHTLYFDVPPVTRQYWDELANQPVPPESGVGFVLGEQAGVDQQKRLWRVGTSNGFDEVIGSTIYAIEAISGFLFTPFPGTVTVHEDRVASSYVYSIHTNLWTQRDMTRRVWFSTPAIDSQGRVYATGGEFVAELGWVELFWDDYSPAEGTGHTVDGYYYQEMIEVGQTTSTCERYSPVFDSWLRIESMNEARQAHLCLVDSTDRVYAIGGASGSSGNYHYTDPAALPTSAGLTPVRGTAIPYSVAVPGLEAGTLPLAVTATMERFDPTAGVWTELEPMPEPASMTTTIFGHANFTGTMDSQDRPVIAWYTLSSFPDPPVGIVKTARYDPQSNKWTQFPELDFDVSSSEARTYIRLGMHRNRVLMFAHIDSAHFTPQPQDGAWIYELEGDQWVAKARMPFLPASSLYVPLAIDDQDRIYIIGGVPPGSSLFPYTAGTSDVNDFILARSCFHQKLDVKLGTIALTENSQEMVEAAMAPINVQITNPHFDPCHPQTQAEPVRIDSQVWVRGPLG